MACLQFSHLSFECLLAARHLPGVQRADIHWLAIRLHHVRQRHAIQRMKDR
jgi:hypothetical protein